MSKCYLRTLPRETAVFDFVRGGTLSSGGINNSLGLMFNASESAQITVKVGFAKPVSIRLMYVRNSPAASAKSSCDKPDASRNCLIRKPKARFRLSAVTSEFDFVGSLLGIDTMPITAKVH
jgi:hypothetical protein